MMKVNFRFMAMLIAVFFSAVYVQAEEPGNSQSIGFYTAGCMTGSAELPAQGEGFQVIRLSRKRYYGHSDLTQYIESLAKVVSTDLGGMLLIGDVAQQNGGPLPGDHNSHQIGLDADILFLQLPIAKARVLTYEEREAMKPISLLTSTKSDLDGSKWRQIHGEILKLAASFEKADRIFVNPLIKRRLCHDYGGQDWLRKIRPWWGHDGHFHVRLHCPADSPLCKSQDPLPSGDGCDADLKSWFTPKGRIKTRKEYKSTPRPKRKMPEECQAILSK